MGLWGENKTNTLHYRYADNIAAVQRIWREVDERGWAVEWRELLNREKMFVGFL